MIQRIYSTYTAYLHTAHKEDKLFFWDNILYSLRAFIEPLMLFILWGTAATISGTTTINVVGLYFIAYTVFARMTLTWIAEDLKRTIQKGDLFGKLLKPLPGGYIAERVLYEQNLKRRRLMATIPMVIVIYIIIAQFVPMPFAPWPQLLLLPLALIGGSIVNFCFWFIVSCTAFWLYDNKGVEDFVDTMIPFFDGTFIPLIFFPGPLAEALKWLPFRYNVSFPLEILTQTMSQDDLLKGTLIMTSWSVLLICISRIVWRKGLKNYQG